MAWQPYKNTFNFLKKESVKYKVTFLYFLLLIADFTENSWWHHELYLVVYSYFAPHRGQSLSPWQWINNLAYFKTFCLFWESYETHQQISRAKSWDFLYSNTWKHDRAKTASRYVDCLLFHFVKPQCFFCSFFTAVIYIYIYIHIIHFHLFHSVNIYWNWLQEQFCNLSLYTLHILSV